MSADRLKVLSVSRGSIPCEFATRLAVDAGLDVIKLELPEGDPLRTRSGHLFSFLAAGKRSIVMERERLASMLPRLIKHCDAIVGDEWGTALVQPFLARSSALITVGERDSSALAGIPPERSDEYLAFHGTGLGFLTPRVMPGYPSAEPLCPQANLVEFLAGLYGSIALFSLLRESRQGGGGLSAKVGLAGTALPLLRREIAAVLYGSEKPHRAERIWKISPAEVHRCQDGWIFVDVIEDIQWRRLCDYLGRPDLAADARFATRDDRFAHAELITPILDEYFADMPQSCWKDAQAHGIPIAPVNSLKDLVEDLQLEARGFWERQIIDVNGSMLKTLSTPLARCFSGEHAGESLRVPRQGEHTAELLAELETL